MSLKLGNTLIAGISQNTKYNAHHLLDFKWTDCIMNDVSWLRADTFSWQSGDVYTSAYNHLVADLQGTTAETETIGSYTITFYRATDGHKITTDESTVADIYNETGIAWYYILDTVNTRFKLPRTKYGFVGLRDNVGKYVAESLPKPKLIMRTDSSSSTDADLDIIYGHDGYTATTPSLTNGSDEYMHRTYTDTSDNLKYMDIIGNSYQDNAPVQPPATQMYLYFYVGDYSQTAIEQTAGLNSSLFNGKADVDLSNINPSQSAKDIIMTWGLPDWSARILVYITTTPYVAPSNGYIIGSANLSGSSTKYYVNNIEVYDDSNEWSFFLIPLSKGDGIKTSASNAGTTYFYPLKGVN